MTGITQHRGATMASGVASDHQTRTALATILVGLSVTFMLLPMAAAPALPMPGFLVVNQTAMAVVYGLGAWMLHAQFMRSRSVVLLIAAAGTLFTMAIVVLQLLSLPGVLAPGRLLGSGPETTTWLWTAWHLGPPVWGLAAAAVLRWRRDAAIPAEYATPAALAACSVALLCAAGCGTVATALLPWLPHQVTGDDYSAVFTSGVGPALEVLTLAALAAVTVVTGKQRSTLDVWILASLSLLVLDNTLTLTGGSRGSVGWTAGRLLAMVSAATVIWAYLHEVESLRARAEAALAGLATTEARLRASQKMEAVGQLTGGIAHDFNNLLMVVTSGFDMIRRRPEDRVRVVRMAEAGLQATERGARLTRQLLTFARRQSLRPETVNPNAQLAEFERLAARAAGEAVQLQFAFDETVHPVQIDASEFEAAILNLIVNARDALAPQGGRVTVGTRNAVLIEPAKEGCLSRGAYVVVSVADNGPGMTPEVASRAFEPFFTTKEFGKGSGLGLSQVYGFARAAGGDVIIRTAPGQGTVVEIWLPRAAVAQPKPAPEHRDHDTPIRAARAGEVVLAVEDEPDVLSAVVENLADLGYHVITARDASEALDRLREPGRIDVLFSDIVMPGKINGVQLAREAVQMRPDLRVLLTSGYANQALEGYHPLPPNLDILPKPYRRADLATRLRLVDQAA